MKIEEIEARQRELAREQEKLANELKILKENKITDFKLGDVYKWKNIKIGIVEFNEKGQRFPSYVLSGREEDMNSLFCDKPKSKSEMIKYLNGGKARLIGRMEFIKHEAI
jgi:hypothetical protein